ncbi:MAG: hypothetical protein WCL27_11205 [Betaproteobacteria bacterium]
MKSVREIALEVIQKYEVNGLPYSRLVDETQLMRVIDETLDAYLAQQEPVCEVYRHGRDSHGREWHGIHWYDPNVDVPSKTKLYLAPPVPAGYQLVPIEPTEAMKDAFARGSANSHRMTSNEYYNMLEAEKEEV